MVDRCRDRFAVQGINAQDLAPRAYFIGPLRSNAITLAEPFFDGGIDYSSIIPISIAKGITTYRRLATIPLDVASWYVSPQGDHMNLRLAEYWFVFVSVPVFQFILLR
jgi:hypothetical protein